MSDNEPDKTANGADAPDEQTDDEAGIDAVVAAARIVRDRAYAPYSEFRVGAAALDTRGVIYAGCNVENASYGLTICAERVALSRAIAEGAAEVELVAIVAESRGDDGLPVMPCGACRQVLAELAPSAVVLLETADGKTRATHTVDELLPAKFDGSQLGGRGKKPRGGESESGS